jgi:hypothetical protein
VEAVVVGAVVAVVGGLVVAVDRVVGVGRVVGEVVDGVDLVGVVVALVPVELSDPVLSPGSAALLSSFELSLSVEPVPSEPPFDLRPFDFLPDLLSEDLSPEDLPSDDFLSDAAVVTLAASAGDWSGGAAAATPPPTDRPTTISSAPVPASA